MPTTIVTLYNHKGGVSKTTTTVNLAHALSEHLGKKVLIVDGDPQCNLTELALARQIEEADALAEKNKTATELPGSTILQALSPRLDGDRADVDVDAIQLVQPDPEWDVHLFRGDIDLSEAEDRLSYAHSQRLTADMHQKRNYIAVHDMLRRLGARDNFDYILVDVGPSAGALTRSCFLACDRFLVPLAPDRFNYQAIRSLSRILKKWIEEHAMVLADFESLSLNVPRGAPQFRGLILQRFQRYGGAPKAGFQFWMDRIPERALNELLPALIEASGDASIVAPGRSTEPTVAKVPEFASLGAIMLRFGKPVWRLGGDTGWSGSVQEQSAERMIEFRDEFFKLAECVDA